jgi:GT2 family glycosyltransferase
MVTVSPVSVISRGELVSILIPCCGMVEYTKLCVPSVLKYTREPYELIFIDIGSLDGTSDYLAGLHAGMNGRTRVEVLRTPTDLGIKELCKAALEQARGEYLCLLNNDTVVTTNWINSLVGLVKLSEGIGMVGPMSNYADPPQLVEGDGVPYRIGPRKAVNPLSALEPLVDVSAVQAYATELAQQHRGKWQKADRLGGFCLLLRRDVITRIGPDLDKHSDLSLFDTDILSALARNAGYNLAVCWDLFIHHFGTRTFAHTAPQPGEVKTAPAVVMQRT